jgi:hypothetical protein
MPTLKAARDAHARTKIDGITRRLDKLERSMGDHMGTSRDHNASVHKRLIAIEKAQAKPEGVGIERALAALRRIQALPCSCERMYKDSGTSIQIVQHVTTAGGHHWTGCHVAIAATGIGE